ncbi:MAG: site-2 protease family protein [Candidatus Bathyarchaeales archaeon]
MNETSSIPPEQNQQTDFEKLNTIVREHFQVEEALVEHNIPTFYLKQPQETKQAFLKLLKKLEELNLIALLRRTDGRLVLKIFQKPIPKPNNTMINWLLFFATIGTTFITGYILSEGLTDPLIGGATFMVAIMAVLGIHEMGHKLTANKEGIEATPPYFIPGPPPIGGFFGIGTFGAVIMQKSLPPNKDALFDVGSSGPIFGFIIAAIAIVVGLPFSVYDWVPEGTPTLPVPLFIRLVAPFLLPPFEEVSKPGYMLGVFLHPVAIAGWIGLFVTMLNLFPAAMLDGGHVAKALFGERAISVLTVLSILALMYISPFMAIFVLFMSMYKHPGPLDDVSSLSTSRKLLAVVLVAIFVLSSFLYDLLYDLVVLLMKFLSVV